MNAYPRATLPQLIPTDDTKLIASANTLPPNRIFNAFELSQLLDPQIAANLTENLVNVFNNISDITMEEREYKSESGRISGKMKANVSPPSIRENLSRIYRSIVEIGSEDIVKTGYLNPDIIQILQLTANRDDPQYVADIVSSFLEATSRGIRQAALPFLNNESELNPTKLPYFLALNREVIEDTFGAKGEFYLNNVVQQRIQSSPITILSDSPRSASSPNRPTFLPTPPPSPPPALSSSSKYDKSSPSLTKTLFSPKPPTEPPPALSDNSPSIKPQIPRGGSFNK